MKYKILTKVDPRKLEEEVESYLEQGWRLQGGISTSTKYSSSTIEYTQAVVLDNKYDVNQR